MTTSFSIPALMIKQPIGELYVAKITAEKLLSMAYADVRAISTGSENYRETYLGIQRRLDSKRGKEIARYVTTFDATFPTSIVIYIDEENISIKENTSFDIVELTIKKIDPRLAKIIDGQHRLAGLQAAIENIEEKLKENLFDREVLEQNLLKIKNFELSLTILIGMDIAEQATVFSKVNLTQTKVNKSLVYDLEEYSKTRSPYKTAHNVVVALNQNTSSPFYKKIKRLGCLQYGDEIITQQTIVESLVKLFISQDPQKDREELMKHDKITIKEKSELENFPFRELFALNKDLEIAEILFNYFSSVKNKWPVAWGNNKYLLSKNNAFRALMKYLHFIYREIKNNNSPLTTQTFDKYFADFQIRDEDFTTNVFKLGESGMREFYRYLIKDINYEDFIKLSDTLATD